MLVSAGTWIAEEVANSGNGLLIEDFSAAAIVDCLRTACTQRIALDALTPNRDAAPRHDEPFSTSDTTRLRRSPDKQ